MLINKPLRFHPENHTIVPRSSAWPSGQCGGCYSYAARSCCSLLLWREARSSLWCWDVADAASRQNPTVRRAYVLSQPLPRALLLALPPVMWMQPKVPLP